MKESRDVNIKTSAFDLTVHWNPSIVGAQACIFIGLIAIAFFAGKGSVRTGCVILMFVDVLTLFIGLLGSGLSFDDEETQQSTPQNTANQTANQNEEVDVEVNHEKNKKSSVKKSSKTIKNKLPMPKGVTPRQSNISTAPVQQSESVAPTPEPVPAPVTEATSDNAQEQSNDQSNIVTVDLDELDLDLFDLL